MVTLIAVPYRASTHPAVLYQAEFLASQLTFRDKRIAFFQNDYGYSRDYSTNARARNDLIEKHLASDIDDVLWVDVDVCRYPCDLIERLRYLRDRTGAQIAAPLVMIHRADSGLDVFYDVAGFQQNGKWIASDIANPPFDASRDLDSVGTCYLIPSSVYRGDLFRAGARYGTHINEANGLPDPEHYSVMQNARAMGLHIRADINTTVWHSWLPVYGMPWQGEK